MLFGKPVSSSRGNAAAVFGNALDFLLVLRHTSVIQGVPPPIRAAGKQSGSASVGPLAWYRGKGLAYCNKHARRIKSKALHVYHVATSGEDAQMAAVCCDFKALERYVREHYGEDCG
ncbi:type III toxin-antitoxin system ToxN/AbiQ family toxin [Adlercreutzia sp. R21]|uniref:type III toxin-antitoxin system ToxN/AbiQ family toxin n=1 Tax=Adlercreutzia wanghongyangiae TaxID=3111451 RepID=UPI002DB80311|nr:type III toxin-antitoxin system ToxN/AbiQ family toxin [Adlercreutzia sp. R21]MEC4184978.1 type III toxin-antitoxin system ToxN/AbiQ family toxin [Adlercreutzia sp. R21]